MTHSYAKKAILSRLLIFLILFLAVWSVSCYQDRDSVKESTEATSQITEGTQNTAISEPTTEERVFEQIETYKFLEIEAGEEYLGLSSGRTNAAVMGNGQAYEIPGILDTYEYAANGVSVAILLDKSESGTGRLIVYDGVMETAVADDVSCFHISNDGGVVAYLTGEYKEGEGCALNLFDCDSGSTSVIAENAGNSFCLSPNGTAIAYIRFNEPGNADSWRCLVAACDDGSPEEIAQDMYPAALSDDGSLVYAIKITNKAEDSVCGELWALCESSNMRLCKQLQNDSQNMYLSIDCSQILFVSDEGICFSQNGSEAILLVPSEELVVTSETSKAQEIYSTDAVSFNSQYAGTRNLYDVLLNVHNENSGSNNVWYFTDGMKSVFLFEDNQYLDYELIDNSLFIYDPLSFEVAFFEDIYSDIDTEESVNEADATKVDSGISSYICTKDKTIYYDKFGEGLIRCGTDGEKESICEDGVLIGYFPREDEPDIIYYRVYDDPENADGISTYISSYYYHLYMVEDVPNSVPIEISDNVGAVYMGAFGVYYLKLDSVSPNIALLYSDEDHDSDETDATYSDLYDQNQLFYSCDGKTFSYEFDLLEWYLYGG